MARNLKKPKSQSLNYQIDSKLNSITRLGTSKVAARQRQETSIIVSSKTRETYQSSAHTTARRIQARHPDCKTLERLEEYYPEDLKMRADLVRKGKLSADTLVSERAAMSKLFDRSGPSWNVSIPLRSRASITRSRNPEKVTTEKYLDKEKYADSLDISHSLGNRRCEFATLQKSKIIKGEIIEGWKIATAADVKANRIHEMFEGDVIVNVTGKGGKNRWIACEGDPDKLLNLLNTRAAKNENGFVFEKDANHKLIDIPDKCDFHGRRRDYAKRQYKKAEAWCLAHGLTREYHMQGDKVGIIFNAAALGICSNLLGHNRLNVVANNYLT